MHSYAVVGTGALGGFYGGRLAKAGAEVHFLCHSDGDHVRAHGLRVDSVEGDFVVRPARAYDAAADMPRPDVVLVALKATTNDALPEILPHLVGDDTAVVAMQNGLGIEELIADIVGPDRVLGGLCFLCSHKVGPGHVRHLDYGFVTLGAYATGGGAGGITPRMESIAADFTAAGIPIETVPDLVLARWQKLVWNVPFNALAAIHRLPTDRLLADPAIRRRAERLMQEVAAAARAAAGREIDEAFLADRMALTEAMTSYAPSMLLDRAAGRPMEVEAIVGAPLRAARAAGVACPEMARLYAELGGA